ncbi:MAG TPA: tetratricopeptide repeat protein [Xanthobacteraceae bacterium]|nr:tetratricopeptide repeat protein [Xanthobacteraceae bacterium]
MGVRVSRVLVAAALCAPWLAGCEGWNKPSEWWNKPPESAQTETGAPPADAQAPAPETTGSIATGVPGPIPGEDSDLRGDLNSDLNLGKRHFREGDYGLAEVHFRRAVEKGLPKARDAAEAWLGLAASYDQLRRFELADRAYAQALKIVGPAPEILNNQGYSYILRGDYARARAKLNAAYAKDPQNPHILANLALLEKAVRPQ